MVEVPRLGKDAAAKAIHNKAIKDWGQPKSKTTHDVFCIFAPGRWSPVVVSDINARDDRTVNKICLLTQSYRALLFVANRF